MKQIEEDRVKEEAAARDAEEKRLQEEAERKAEEERLKQEEAERLEKQRLEEEEKRLAEEVQNRFLIGINYFLGCDAHCFENRLLYLEFTPSLKFGGIPKDPYYSPGEV